MFFFKRPKNSTSSYIIRHDVKFIFETNEIWTILFYEGWLN